ncbi:hypothetical protein PG996_002602 [Apiospora saccharicola]|uniref:Uncharacterized protein n=1 Tax=Apiospora saccharicola TaxID=335842 RepID=A0ABR1WJY1_9PEZI
MELFTFSTERKTNFTAGTELLLFYISSSVNNSRKTSNSSASVGDHRGVRFNPPLTQQSTDDKEPGNNFKLLKRVKKTALRRLIHLLLVDNYSDPAPLHLPSDLFAPRLSACNLQRRKREIFAIWHLAWIILAAHTASTPSTSMFNPAEMDTTSLTIMTKLATPDQPAFDEAVGKAIDKTVYKTVCKAMKEDDTDMQMDFSSGPAAIDMDCSSSLLASSEPKSTVPKGINTLVRPFQSLNVHDLFSYLPKQRMIDSDIKREKKRKRVQFSDEDPEIIGIKKIKKIKVDKQWRSSSSATEPRPKKIKIKSKKANDDDASKPKQDEQTEPNQGTKKRLGPVYYYTKRRQRLTLRHGEPPIPSPDVVDPSTKLNTYQHHS